MVLARALLLIVLFCSTAYGQWRRDSTQNTFVAYPVVSFIPLSDQTGGVYVVYMMLEGGSQILAYQHLDSNGNRTNGTAGTILQDKTAEWFDATSDEQGGFFAVSSRDSFIVVHHVDESGTLTWSSTGVTIKARYAAHPTLSHDGAGGVYVVWNYAKLQDESHLLAQHVSSNGSISWSSPTVIDSIGGTKPRVIRDGSNGIIAVYHHQGSEPHSARVDIGGNVLWRTNLYPEWDWKRMFELNFIPIVSNGRGGAIVGFHNSVTTEYDPGRQEGVFTQQVDSSGKILWDPRTRRLAVADSQYALRMTSDDAGGAWYAWTDYRIVPSIYLQHIDSEGQELLGPNGKMLMWSSGIDYDIFPDGNGGLYFVEDASGWTNQVWHKDQSVLRINSSGDSAWERSSIITGAPANQIAPRIVTHPKGPIAVFLDLRKGAYPFSLYAQAFDTTGQMRGSMGASVTKPSLPHAAVINSNPVATSLCIYGSYDGWVRVYDGVGRQVLFQPLLGIDPVIDCNQLPVGMYTFKIESGARSQHTGRFIKK